MKEKDKDKNDPKNRNIAFVDMDGAHHFRGEIILIKKRKKVCDLQDLQKLINNQSKPKKIKRRKKKRNENNRK